MASVIRPRTLRDAPPYHQPVRHSEARRRHVSYFRKTDDLATKSSKSLLTMMSHTFFRYMCGKATPRMMANRRSLFTFA